MTSGESKLRRTSRKFPKQGGLKIEVVCIIIKIIEALIPGFII